jgi:hypothetical protein
MSVGSSEAQGRPQRPIGMTLFCLLLGWLALGALMNAALLFPQLDLPLYMTAVALAYAVTAGAAAFGLWRMRPWGLTAFRAWGLALLVSLLAFIWVFDFPSQFYANPAEAMPLFLATTGVIVLVYSLMYLYIRRRLSPRS